MAIGWGCEERLDGRAIEHLDTAEHERQPDHPGEAHLVGEGEHG